MILGIVTITVINVIIRIIEISDIGQSTNSLSFVIYRHSVTKLYAMSHYIKYHLNGEKCLFIDPFMWNSNLK